MAVMELLKEIEVKAQEGQVGIAAELQERYDTGFKDGKAVGFKEGQDSIVLPDPSNPNKLYTQEDMDKLAAQVASEKDAEYAPKLAEKDALVATAQADAAQAKLDLETLKTDFDSKVVNGAMARVDTIKALAKDAVLKMAVADQPIADQTVADLDKA
jgi:flagellar biosynthesis/type III secretory pathway protein FliH